MKRLCYAISSIALAAASPALADTSAAELWAEWQAQSALTGQTLSAEATPTANGLTLTNFTTEFADTDFSAVGSIDEVTLIENADGTVSVTYSDLYTVTFTFVVDPGDPPGNFEVLMRHENLQMNVSGDAGARAYAYSADTITVTDGEIWGGGSEPPSIDLDLVMTDIDTTYTVTGTDPEETRFASDGSLGSLSMVLEISDPRNPGVFKAGMIIGAMNAVSEGSIQSLGSLEQYGGALPEGFDISGTTNYGPLGFEFLFEDDYESFGITYTNDGGAIGAAVSSEALNYDISASGANATILSRDLPVPVQLSTGSSEISLTMPLSASDTPQDMRLRVGVQDLLAGEGLMAMIDPTGGFPRDPASLLLDATGQLQLFVDLMTLDPDELNAPPGELRALMINELRISAGGAELTGTADVTFAPGQLIPMPVGSANIELSGGNALMDALVAGGMVPAAQSGMIMGMANVFARPGAAPDTLETTVEFGADGSITANGVPLQ